MIQRKCIRKIKDECGYNQKECGDCEDCKPDLSIGCDDDESEGWEY